MATSSMTIEPLYVVDTNALIWYLTNDRKLSRRAAPVFAAAERGETRLYISAIVVAELYYADKKWKFFADFTQTYEAMKVQPYFRFVAFLADEVLDFEQNSAATEMHDRMIIGLAKHLGAPLLTSDPILINAGIAEIVW